MGRNKIRIEKIKSNRNRNVTFNKRRKGLIKKAMELALLCDVEIFLTIVNKSGESISIFSSHRNPEDFCDNYLKKPIMATDVCSLKEYSSVYFEKTKDDSKSISAENIIKDKDQNIKNPMQIDNTINLIETKRDCFPLNQYDNVIQNKQMEINQTNINNMSLNQLFLNNFNTLFSKDQSQSLLSFDNLLLKPFNYEEALRYLQLQHFQSSNINTNTNTNINANGIANYTGNQYEQFFTKKLQFEHEPLLQKEVKYNFELLNQNLQELLSNNSQLNK